MARMLGMAMGVFPVGVVGGLWVFRGNPGGLVGGT
jgi:hypothetical protein